MIEFSNRLKILRKNSSITQDTLAAKLGVSRGCISAWESGTLWPSIHRLIQIAEFFQVSTDYLLGFSSGGKQMIDVSMLRNDEITVINNILLLLNNRDEK